MRNGPGPSCSKCKLKDCRCRERALCVVAKWLISELEAQSWLLPDDAWTEIKEEAHARLTRALEVKRSQ